MVMSSIEAEPCSICGTPVLSEFQQAITQELYCRILCNDCESSYIWGQF
ncbi:MAG TPA: hypothetical protein VGK06_15230 [Methanosarcina sp.]